ncbi:MAG: DUF2281 domain-containing protein [Sinomicrobium sp.]|nr:DUF2281 domain-containing protein [Sinomicrobium sp.]
MTDLHLYIKLSSLSPDLKKEVADFIDFLQHKSKRDKKQSKRPAGLARGMIKISDDFDDPLDDFSAYM